MVTQIWFLVLVAAVALERLLELRVSRRHERALRARGAQEHAAGQMPWMVAVHTGWLIAMPLEVWIFQRPLVWAVAAPALAVFAIGQGLRYVAMRALGPRWTVRVLTLPDAPPVSEGPFKHIRHPNYFGVVLEMAALPLVHCAYLTALVFSAANALVLWRRIRAEERALAQSSDYAARFRERPRFVPGRGA